MNATNTLHTIAQQAAEMLWACATSDDNRIAWSRSPIYIAAETNFIDIVAVAYGITPRQALAVRDLLAEYGPDDSLTGTSGRGVASYVQHVRDYAHNPDYFTCPGEGIKCLCWDIEHG